MKNAKSLFITEDTLGIVTDFYQLSMVAGYFEQGMNDIVTFEFFVRHLPKNRSYLVTAGLEQVLHYLTHITFSQKAIGFLKQVPLFKQVSKEFFEYLEKFKFSGSVHAMPEGTVAFADEPIIRVTAPLIEAQIIETYLLATLNFQTAIATKASRIVYAAQGRDVIDFGTRRAHGAQAGVHAARACFIGGCNGTSNVFAAYELGIPPIGTIAHSWVMVFENELESFRKYHEVFPEHTILLIDTYDTLTGAKHATAIGDKLRGVRIDSGDLLKLSREVRKILDDSKLNQVKIVASGDLNEFLIDGLVKRGAPIDSFGVGTEMVTSKDAPALGGVYKLVEQEHEGKLIPKMKFSEDKATYPCKKQVYRIFDTDNNFSGDVVGLENEDINGTPLLQQIVKNGRPCYRLPAINEVQKTARDNITRLPQQFKRLENLHNYPITKSKKLEMKKKEAELLLSKVNI